MTLVAIIVAAVVVVGGAGVAGAIALASSSRKSATVHNQVVPGVDTGAPASWFGAHSPEARLHRRLRDAVAAMRNNPAFADPSMVGVQSDIEAEALALDRQLVAVAALPATTRGDRVERLTTTVADLETLVAEAVDTAARSSSGQGGETIRTRLALIAQARADVAGLSSTTMDAMREVIEAEAAAAGPSATESNAEPAGDADPSSGGESAT